MKYWLLLTILIILIILIIILLINICRCKHINKQINSTDPSNYFNVKPDDSKLLAKYDSKKFYQDIEIVIPQASIQRWKNDIEVYMPYMEDCSAGCTIDDINIKTGYFSWVSKLYKQPIVTGYISDCINNNCNFKGDRPSCQFTSCLDKVNTFNYSNTGWDRGHMVPSQSMIEIENNGSQTFSMCNISPQTKLMNQSDWNKLEIMLNNGKNGKKFYILQGPLFDDSNKCLKQKKPSIICTDGAIRIPYAFWKIAIQQLDRQWKTWVWIYDKAQTTGDPNIYPFDNYINGPLQTMRTAYAGIQGIEFIENNLDIKFPEFLKDKEVIQNNCEDLGCRYVFVGFLLSNESAIKIAIDLDTCNMVDYDNVKKIMFTPLEPFNKNNPFDITNYWYSQELNKKINIQELSRSDTYGDLNFYDN